MKAAKSTLASALIAVAFMVLMMLPQPVRAATEHKVRTPGELAALLGSVPSGDTIRLEADIDYNTANPGIDNIRVIDKTITFDLNGYTLNVTTATGHGLEVGSGGVVDIEDTSLAGDGEFNVTSSDGGSFGVYAANGG